jgi:hypothetical protein
MTASGRDLRVVHFLVVALKDSLTLSGGPVPPPAVLINGFVADSFARQGFKTEGRKLKIQSDTTIKLISKALDEMPKIDAWEGMVSVLSGGMTAKHRAARQNRGKHFARIAHAEKVMLKTLRNAFDSLYKTRDDWSRREQIQAKSRMMKAVIESPKKKAQEWLAVSSDKK